MICSLAVGFYTIITAILGYVVDSYGHYSASALAGVVLVRNLFGAIFPLFSDQMYQKVRADSLPREASLTRNIARQSVGDDTSRLPCHLPRPCALLSLSQGPSCALQESLL
jgi:hypothetical protein